MRVVLVLIQAFVALTALVGGWLLMQAPDGHLLQLPLAVLTHAPFTDFFWPGVLLFGGVGGGHAVGLVLTVRRAPLAGTGALLLGVGTVVWIGVQVLMTDPLFWIQGLIAGLGVAEAALGGWLVRRG